MSYISLSEFRSLSGLPDPVILNLLQNNLLPISFSEAGNLQIDTSKVAFADLIKALSAKQDSEFNDNISLYDERIYRVILDLLDPIIDQVVTRLARQIEQVNTDDK